VASADRRVELLERLKELWLVFRRDPGPRVGDSDGDTILVS
jgi:hypothetical protein